VGEDTGNGEACLQIDLGGATVEVNSGNDEGADQAVGRVNDQIANFVPGLGKLQIELEPAIIDICAILGCAEGRITRIGEKTAEGATDGMLGTLEDRMNIRIVAQAVDY